MRKTSLISIAALAGLLVCLFTEADFARQRSSRRKVLIGFKEAAGRQTAESRRRFIRGHGGSVRRCYRSFSAVAAEFPDSQISGLRANPSVAYIEEDGLLYALDSEMDASWGVKRVGAGEIHANANKGAGVKVAVIDSGIDLDHPDLAVAGDVTFVEDTTSGDDDHGHGTHCAGIIAALDNDTGVVGVAPQASIYAVKVLDSTGTGYLSDVAAGIDWAIGKGVDIISLSIGTNVSYQTLREACDRANDAGIIVVAAAGNDYRIRRGNERDTLDYPARYDSVIAVGAIDDTDTKAYFSSTGSTLEFVAPGVYVYSTDTGGGYGMMSGTSMACPHVVGVAALVLSGPGGDVRTVLQESAEDLGEAGWDKWYGYGLVNATTAAYEPVVASDVAVISVVVPSPVVQGDTVPIEVTVANQGPSKETFDVVLTESPDGFTDTATVTNLAAGASATVSFSWGTADATADLDHTLTATAATVHGETDTEDNSLSTQVMVEPAFTDIAITAVEVPSSVVQGEEVAINVTIENVGNREVADDIAVNLADETDGILVGTSTIVGGLAPGASEALTFTRDTTAVSLGEHVLTASHDVSDDDDRNDSSGAVVTVKERPAEPEEFTFVGTVRRGKESGHIVSVSGTAIMYVRLTWIGRDDLRLRLCDPAGDMVEVDASTPGARFEEIVIGVGPGDWQIAAKSNGRRRLTRYTIQGAVVY